MKEYIRMTEETKLKIIEKCPSLIYDQGKFLFRTEIDDDFSEIQEYIKEVLKIANEIPSKSLESTGKDLCGCSQDDVWEEAIDWYKKQLNDAVYTEGVKE